MFSFLTSQYRNEENGESEAGDPSVKHINDDSAEGEVHSPKQSGIRKLLFKRKKVANNIIAFYYFNRFSPRAIASYRNRPTTTTTPFARASTTRSRTPERHPRRPSWRNARL